MMKNKCDKDLWYLETDKFKKTRMEVGRHINGSDLTKHGLYNVNWYIFNAPIETKITKYSDFVKWCGFKMPKNYTGKNLLKEDFDNYILRLANSLDHDLTLKDIKNAKNTHIKVDDICKFYNSFNDMKRKLGLNETGTYKGHAYSENELIEILQNFVKTNGFIPSSKFVDDHSKEFNLPNRKTFTNKLGKWNEVLIRCGYNLPEKYSCDKNNKITLKHDNKAFLINIIDEYIIKYNEVPTMKKISNFYNTDLKAYYIKHFGSWNNCLKEMELKLNSVSKYSDEELDFYFNDFINKYKRVPTIVDFNKTDRPSFWVYQNKFGSWSKTCIHYGVKPNYRDAEWYMEDGERCDSSYEFDISVWLKSKNINYERNVDYHDFIDDYKGKMNCDYKIVIHDKVWYVEMAGFLRTYDFKKLSKEEQKYFFKLKYKIKLLKRQKCNYLIISVDDFKNKSLSEIFYFIN